MASKTDFADWLSPVLVKELRQGMRARVFVSSFLALQAAMILCAMFGVIAASSGKDTGISDGFFWTIIGAFVMFVMPMSGLGAIANEHKANTLDLIFLTRLNARRIIIGKWLAIVAQTALFICAVLPYAVLRYFLGGIDVGRDLLTLGGMMLGSALLAGIAVGCSPFQNKIGRAFFIIAIILGLQVLGPLIVMAVIGASSSTVLAGPVLGGWVFYVAAILLGGIVLALALEIGASKIAPPAENHSSIIRLLGLGAAGIAAAGLSLPLPGLLAIAPCLVLLPICLGAVSETVRMIPSVYRPFVRRGLPGRIAGALFYPGWPSGILFVIAVLGLLAAALAIHHPIRWTSGEDEKRLIVAGVAAVGTLLLPAAILRAFFPNFRSPGVFNFIIYAACIVLLAGAAMLDQFSKTKLLWLPSLLPPGSVFFALTQQQPNRWPAQDWLELSLRVNIAIAAGSLLLLLLLSLREWRKIRTLEGRAQQQLAGHAAA